MEFLNEPNVSSLSSVYCMTQFENICAQFSEMISGVMGTVVECSLYEQTCMNHFNIRMNLVILPVEFFRTYCTVNTRSKNGSQIV